VFLLALVTTLWYIACYLTAPSMPANRPELYQGWWGWWDQGQYYKTAAALAQGRLEPSVYWYGYPLLGAVFHGLIPRHPFFFPNLLCTILIAGCFFYACRRYLTRPESWLLLVVGVFLNKLLVPSVVWPWNTIPFYAAVFLCAYLCVFSNPSLPHIGLCSLAAGVSTFCRPPDTMFLAVLVLAGIFSMEGRKAKLAGAGIFALACSLPLVLQAAANYQVYGSLSSPYLRTVAAIGFSLHNWPLRFYQMFLDPSILFDQAALPSGIIERIPAVAIAVPGLLLLWKRCGLRFFAFAMAIGASVIFYAAFNSTASPPHFWRYGNYHYIWWITPWFLLFGYLSLRHAWKELRPRVYVAALLLPLCLLATVGYGEKVIASSRVTNQRPAALQVAQSLDDGTLVCRIGLTVPVKTHDVRLVFAKTPRYDLTASAQRYKVRVKANDTLLTNYAEYHLAQMGKVVHLSFAFSKIAESPIKKLTLWFPDAGDASIARVELVRAEFSMGAYVRSVARRHHLSRIWHRLGGDDHGPETSMHLGGRVRYSRPLFLDWGPGCYGQESLGGRTWRWCKSSARVTIRNSSDELRRVRLAATIYAGGSPQTKLRIESELFQDELTITQSGTRFTKTFPVPPGAHEIKLSCGGEPVRSATDPRFMVFRVEGFELAELE